MLSQVSRSPPTVVSDWTHSSRWVKTHWSTDGHLTHPSYSREGNRPGESMSPAYAHIASFRPNPFRALCSCPWYAGWQVWILGVAQMSEGMGSIPDGFPVPAGLGLHGSLCDSGDHENNVCKISPTSWQNCNAPSKHKGRGWMLRALHLDNGPL